ncbi:hypothetical protein [Mesorhizobium sp.]|nr:hypothetical protein [Mesorhizobium sp.]
MTITDGREVFDKAVKMMTACSQKRSSESSEANAALAIPALVSGA